MVPTCMYRIGRQPAPASEPGCTLCCLWERGGPARAHPPPLLVRHPPTDIQHHQPGGCAGRRSRRRLVPRGYLCCREASGYGPRTNKNSNNMFASNLVRDANCELYGKRKANAANCRAGGAKRSKDDVKRRHYFGTRGSGGV